MATEKRKYELKERAKRQAQTHERIVKATVELHEEVGPAKTTIAEVARRAGVQRLTVYNHFPEEAALFAACQSRFLARHPPPRVEAHFAIDDPEARVAAVLRDFYGRYRETARMTEHVQRDRATVKGLDDLLARTGDPMLAELADGLSAAFGDRSKSAGRDRRALITVALDFWTWRRLTGEGLSDGAAAELMARSVASTG